MAISVTNIGNNSNSTGATVAITVPVGGVPAGALIFVAVDEGVTIGNPAAAGTVADTAVNGYTGISSLGNNNSTTTNGRGSTYYVKNCLALVSGNMITYTKNVSGNNAAISAFYATGIDKTAPLDTAVTTTAFGLSTTPSVTSGAPAGSGELFVGTVTWRGASTDTFTQDATNGAYATPPTQNIATTGADVAGGNLVNAGSGAKIYAPTITSHSWSAFICAFKAAATQSPFVQTDWPNPTSVTWYREWSKAGNNFLLARPFGQTDWPVPTAPVYWDKFYNESLILYTLSPVQIAFPFNQTDWPNPVSVVWYRDWIQPSLKVVVTQQSPFNQLDWPNSQRLTWYQDHNQNLVLTHPSGKPFNQKDWPLPQRQEWYREWFQNLLETTLKTTVVVLPFRQTDWPIPSRVNIQGKEWSINLLETTLGGQVVVVIEPHFRPHHVSMGRMGNLGGLS